MTRAVELAQVASLGVSEAFKNRIINGAMVIWQRGTSFAAIGTGIYSADRWKSTISGTSLNLTASQSTSVPSIDFAYSLQYQQISSTATSVTEYAARQIFELVNVRDLAGKIITVSFWYRSNVTGTHGVRILPLGTTGGVDTSVAITVTSANTWEYKTVTTTALSALTSWGATADNGAALILDIGLRVNGVGQTTIAANDYFQLTGVQLEVGSSATSFEYRPYGTELILCQRYYESGFSYLLGTNAGAGNSIGNVINFKVTKRAQPTVTLSNFTNVVNTDLQSVVATYSDGSGFTHAFRIITGAANSSGSGNWAASIEL
jgi:hypothetical protein